MYEALGRPHVWFGNVAGFSFALDFILFEEYKEQLSDPELLKICSSLRTAIVAWVLLNAVYILYWPGTRNVSLASQTYMFRGENRQ